MKLCEKHAVNLVLIRKVHTVENKKPTVSNWIGLIFDQVCKSVRDTISSVQRGIECSTQCGGSLSAYQIKIQTHKINISANKHKLFTQRFVSMKYFIYESHGNKFV